MKKIKQRFNQIRKILEDVEQQRCSIGALEVMNICSAGFRTRVQGVFSEWGRRNHPMVDL